MLSRYLSCIFLCFHQCGRLRSLPTVGTTLTSSEEWRDATALAAWKVWSEHQYNRLISVTYTIDPTWTTDTNILVNQHIKRNQTDPVIDVGFIDDVTDKVAYCRCWKSKKFPLCDGAHNNWNVRTGDNVGPLFIKDENVLKNYTEWYEFMKAL